MLRRIRAALAAFIAPEMIQTPAPDNTLTGGAHDQATALQTRDVDSLTVDRSTTHTGPTVTNNAHGPVGFQAGDVSGGIVNVGGTNSVANTALRHGATVDICGTHTGQRRQPVTISDDINY